MRKYLPVVVGIAAILLASPSLAKKRSELEMTSIKAATDCVAAAASNNPKVLDLYRQNKLKKVTDWIVLKSDACENPLTAMRLLHDRLYGAGTGRDFLLGDYLADLPRAVGERIRKGVMAYGKDEESQWDKPLAPDDILRPKNIAANDVLMIREYPDNKFRVIGTIPPDGRGIRYLGEASGDWLFVRYENFKGWVHSRYVEREKPPVSKGGRLDSDE